ncbi:MAG: hypothetical protein WKG00_41180 [Polyangiaceae bacterium]
MTRSLRPLLLWLLVAVATLAVPTAGHARGTTQVEWANVDAPSGPDQARLERTLRKLLVKASKKASFGGRGGKVRVSARVSELVWEDKGDVVRLSCTVVGRIEGGPSAKSRISFGGAPAQRAALEKQVLEMVANGVVTRLAEIANSREARAHAEAERRKAADAEEKAAAREGGADD